METDPVSFGTPLLLAYPLSGGVVDVVPAGSKVAVDRAFQPGRVQVMANGTPCRESAEIAAGVESDMVLDIQASGTCSIALRYTHLVGAIHHPILGGVFGAIAPLGAVVTLRSLDPASGFGPVAVTSGSDGVSPFEVPLGRYEVTASLAGEVIRSEEIEFEPGTDIVVDLMGLRARVPRDCGKLATTTCETVIRAAMRYGQWVRPTDIVTSVAVRTTEVRSCDPMVDPQLDVIFKVAPDGVINATVGMTPTGDWLACPPY
jgi:hypothetical protein